MVVLTHACAVGAGSDQPVQRVIGEGLALAAVAMVGQLGDPQIN